MWECGGYFKRQRVGNFGWLALLTCAGQAVGCVDCFDFYQLDGQLVDAQTGDPLVGANVSFVNREDEVAVSAWHNPPPWTGTTGDNGDFSVETMEGALSCIAEPKLLTFVWMSIEYKGGRTTREFHPSVWQQSLESRIGVARGVIVVNLGEITVDVNSP